MSTNGHKSDKCGQEYGTTEGTFFEQLGTPGGTLLLVADTLRRVVSPAVG